MSKWAVWLLTLLVSLVFAVGPACGARKTRDLVFEDEEETSATSQQESTSGKKQVRIAVKVAMELKRDGQTTTVLPSHTFQNGDRVKFIYTTNVDAYVYWLSQGTSGDFYMLFPNPKVGSDNFVKKNEVYTIPVKGSFKFTGKPGVEKILLVMAPQKIPELEKAAQEAAVKGGKVEEQAGQISSVQSKTQTKRKSRDLVFEEDDDEESGISTSSQVSTDISEPMVVYYELRHK